MMYLLYDSEIKDLARKAEEIISHQRSIMAFLQKEGSNLIIPHTGKDLAEYLLKNIHHLPDDQIRLQTRIEKNMSDME